MLQVVTTSSAIIQALQQKCRFAGSEQLTSVFPEQVSGWELREDEQKRLRLRRRLVAKHFAAGLELCRRIGELAEEEGHHPDLHLTVSGTLPRLQFGTA